MGRSRVVGPRGGDRVSRGPVECPDYPSAVLTLTVGALGAFGEFPVAMRRSEPRSRMTEAEIKAIVDKLADIARVLQNADPDDKAEIFRQLGLRLTYHPGRRLFEAQIEAPQHWYSDCVRGGT
jgi:hypothetical protein